MQVGPLVFKKNSQSPHTPPTPCSPPCSTVLKSWYLGICCPIHTNLSFLASNHTCCSTPLLLLLPCNSMSEKVSTHKSGFHLGHLAKVMLFLPTSSDICFCPRCSLWPVPHWPHLASSSMCTINNATHLTNFTLALGRPAAHYRWHLQIMCSMW